MQQTSKETMLQINQMHSICFHLFLDGVRQDRIVCSAKYTAAVSQSDAFTLGNACASKLEITLDGVHRDLYGETLEVKWSVTDGEEYPLISGTVDKVTVSGGRTKAEIYDAMYTGGARVYQPAEICLSACTGADVLRDIASGMGVTLDAETAESAAEIALTEGVGNMGAECSLSAAAGTVAALMGGNAIITRAGTLAVVCYSETGWASECYQSGGAADNENWTPGSLTFQRTDKVRSTGEDGTTVETNVKSDFTAGTGDGVAQSNQLATQTLTEGAFEHISSLVIRPGNYTLPGGLLLEPGDVVTLDGFRVPVMGLTLDFDGGIKATVTAAANAAKGGAAGPVSQALSRIEADIAAFKQLSAENFKATSAYVQKITSDEAFVQKLVSNIAEIADFTIMEHWIQSSGTYTNEGGFDADVSMYLRNTDGIQPPQIEFGSRGDALFDYPTLALLTVGGGGTRATGVTAFDWVKLSACDMVQGLEAFLKIWAKNRLVEISASTVQADGDLSISGSIKENGTKLSDKYAAKTHTHGEYATWYTMTASDIDAGSPFASGFSIGSAVINNVGYLRFDIRWMTLEFKLEQPSKGLHVRYKYGDSAWTAWSKL